jgi:hypothetical protein
VSKIDDFLKIRNSSPKHAKIIKINPKSHKTSTSECECVCEKKISKFFIFQHLKKNHDFWSFVAFYSGKFEVFSTYDVSPIPQAQLNWLDD